VPVLTLFAFVSAVQWLAEAGVRLHG